MHTSAIIVNGVHWLLCRNASEWHGDYIDSIGQMTIVQKPYVINVDVLGTVGSH